MSIDVPTTQLKIHLIYTVYAYINHGLVVLKLRSTLNHAHYARLQRHNLNFECDMLKATFPTDENRVTHSWKQLKLIVDGGESSCNVLENDSKNFRIHVAYSWLCLE